MDKFCVGIEVDVGSVVDGCGVLKMGVGSGVG